VAQFNDNVEIEEEEEAVFDFDFSDMPQWGVSGV
jgi:hypothetical protein